MAAGIYSATGDMQVMSSNAHHHHAQYSLQQQQQQQRGAPQSSAPSSYPTATTSNGPAHYQQQHHGAQLMPQQQPQPGGYNNNSTSVNGASDRSRPRGGGGVGINGEDEEQQQQHRRRRSRSNNRRSATTTSNTTTTTSHRNNGGGGESYPSDNHPHNHSHNHHPQGAGGGGGQQPPSHHHHQFQYPAGVGVSNNVTPPSQDTTSGSGNLASSTNNNNNNASSSSSSAQAALDAAQRRPSYLLHRDLVIGKGSYGQVCIASRGEAEGHHSSSRSGKRKKFACKCVMLRNDPKYIAKLQEEVNVLRELRGHDNVIRLFDVFCVDNELFIITELGRGGDLFHLLTTHPKHGVTEAYAAKTVAEMLSAVSFLHSRHICHRDLKLENWVLESGKDVWSPLKLIDFGLSTHYTPGHRLSRVVGSSYYVAPEVLKKSYTEACDLWSLGVIVYMLLSGAPPFYGRNDEAIKASIVHGQYQFPHELFRDVSDDAMAFVSCLLSYSIEYRYTAEQALAHPWLRSNCDPEMLQRAKDGARGVVSVSDGYDINAMQM